jgi:hypothetical protein
VIRIPTPNGIHKIDQQVGYMPKTKGLSTIFKYPNEVGDIEAFMNTCDVAAMGMIRPNVVGWAGITYTREASAVILFRTG